MSQISPTGTQALAPRAPAGSSLTRIAVWVLVAVAAVLLLAAPQLLNLYWLRILTNICMFAILAQGINLIAGYTGYPAFGNVVFFGLGAYSTAVVMVKFGGSFPLGLAVGVGLSLLFTALIGPPLLRLRGHYFAIATLALNEATKTVVGNLDITDGGMGLSLPLPPGSVIENAGQFYYLYLGVMAASILIAWLIQRSPLGYACRAIRSDELAAACSGINTTLVKTSVWAISAVLTSVAGGIYAYWLSYVDPSGVFDMTLAVKAFVIFLLGGAATLFGPLLGAGFIEIITTLTWTHLLSFHVGTLGAIIIVVVLFIPNGFIPMFKDRAAVLAALFRPRTGR